MKAALIIALAGVWLLGGCADAPVAPEGNSAFAQSPLPPQTKSNSGVVLVADEGAQAIYVLAFPHLSWKWTTTGVEVLFGGMCSDAAGNVWLANNAEMFEFNHLGKLINTLHMARGYAQSCAVNPRNGDLAVLLNARHNGTPHVAVYCCASKNPVRLVIPGLPRYDFGAYDSNGNLFVDGYNRSSEQFELGVVPENRVRGHLISISGGTINIAGFVQWYAPGNYLAVADSECGTAQLPCIHHVEISGSPGTITGTTFLEGPSGSQIFYLAQGVIDPVDGSLVAGTRGPSTRSVLRWSYPAGGEPIDRNEVTVKYPVGAALSTK